MKSICVIFSVNIPLFTSLVFMKLFISNSCHSLFTGHIGFSVTDVEAACQRFESFGVKFIKKPSEGNDTIQNLYRLVLEPSGLYFTGGLRIFFMVGVSKTSSFKA